MKKEDYKWQKYTAAWSKAKMVVVKQKNYIENVKKCRIIIHVYNYSLVQIKNIVYNIAWAKGSISCILLNQRRTLKMSYVDEVIELVIAKNPAQPEFHQAVKEVLESLRTVVEANEEEYRKKKLK